MSLSSSALVSIFSREKREKRRAGKEKKGDNELLMRYRQLFLDTLPIPVRESMNQSLAASEN